MKPIDLDTRRSTPWGYLAIVVVLLAGVEAAATAMAFLCDDAYIAFRYVHNAHAGDGLVWNPGMPPVEGYTSFSWVMMLWAVWIWTGIEPPEAALPLAMLWHVFEFGVVAAAAASFAAPAAGRWRHALPVATVLAVASSRTFLQWMSGGLETATFNTLLVSWVLLGFHRAAGSTRWFVIWSSVAALAALTRPDGLLLALVTGAGIALRSRDGLGPTAIRLLPMFVVLLHVAWRRSYYGEWLPNTYYAKVGETWPDAGVRYLACFALESGAWLLPLVALPWLVLRIVRRHAPSPMATLVVATVLTHLGFYVIAVGGDHFEYRVLSHLPPLVTLAVVAMARDISARRWVPFAALAALVGAASFGWLHAARTSPMPMSGFRPIADQVPTLLRPIAQWYDRQQAWLIYHRIGLRCRHHGRILESFRDDFPARMALHEPVVGLPTRVVHSVGYIGWVMPEVAILDYYGLNDWVVARWRVPPTRQDFDERALRSFLDAVDTDRDGWLDRVELGAAIQNGMTGRTDRPMAGHGFLVEILLQTNGHRRDDALDLDEALAGLTMLLDARLMAHERHPPDGYFEALEPNVEIVDDHLVARPRKRPLDLDAARRIEAEWRDRVRSR